MDGQLKERLEKLADQIDALKEAESNFLGLEANRKVLFSQMFLEAPGKNIAEKEAHVYSNQDWIDFTVAHVGAESDFNHEKRRYELQLKAYDAAHLSLKVETPVIRRQA